MAFRDRISQPSLRVEVSGYQPKVISGRHAPVSGHDGEIEPIGQDWVMIHSGFDPIKVDGRILGPMSRKKASGTSDLIFGGKRVAISVA